MSGRPARPRRSEPKSYVDLFIPMDLGSSSDSSSSDDAAAAAAGDDAPRDDKDEAKGKRKKKAKRRLIPMSDDDDDSDISEWEEEPKPTAADGTGKQASSSEDDDDDLASAVETEESDGPAEEPEYEGDYASEGGGGSDRTGSGHHHHLPRLKGVKARAPGPRVSVVAANSSSSTPRQTLAELRALARRARPPKADPPSLLEVPYHTIGPQYEPPIRKLVKGARAVVGGTVEQRHEAADDHLRMRLLDAWAVTPFGPEKELLQDMGWWKGKWEEDKGQISRWGGWYDEVKTEMGQVMSEEAVEPHLPQLIYPSVPSKIDLPADLLEDGGKGKDATPPPDDDIAEDELGQRESLKVWLGSVAEGEEQQKVELGRFEHRRLDEFLPRKPGFVLNAGGAVLGLDWCPLPDPPKSTEYLAVSTVSSPSATISHATTPGPSLIQIWSLDMSVSTDFAIETHETDSGAGMQLELGLCISAGDAWEIKWCPRGGQTDAADAMEVDDEENGRLGILAGAFADGSVSLFAVPHPAGARAAAGTEEGQSCYLEAKPILRLSLPDTTCISVAWASHETLAAGCSNGYIAIFDVGSALRSGSSTARPLQYFSVHTAAVKSLAFLRTPPVARSLDGTLNTEGEPNYLSSAGQDGSTKLIDLEDSTAPIVMNHDRGVVSAVAWSAHAGCVVAHDSDACIRLISIRARDFTSTRSVVKLFGSIRDIATSDHHPWIAAGSADGTCSLSNAIRAGRKKSYRGHYVQKAFRLDFNRRLGEYRMLDNLKVEELPGIDVSLRAPSKATAKDAALYVPLTGAWSPHVAVSRVAWHPALNRACLLASGTVSGLLRVDWIEGGEGFA